MMAYFHIIGCRSRLGWLTAAVTAVGLGLATPAFAQALLEPAAATAGTQTPTAAEPATQAPPPEATTSSPPASPTADPAQAAPPATPAPAPPAASAADLSAEQDALDEIRQPSSYLRTTIDNLEGGLDAARENEEELSRQRIELEALLAASDLFLESLQPRYQTVRSQIEKLGPPPGKDQPPEALPIQAERQRLDVISAEIDGAIKATGLVQYRARELLGRIQVYRTRLFTSQLFRRNASPLSPSIWSSVAEALPAAATELKWTFWRWRRSAEGHIPALLGLLGAAIAVYFGLSAVRRRIVAARLDSPRDEPPDFFQRAGTAGLVASLNVLPAALTITVLAFGLDNLGLWFLDSDPIVMTVLPAALVFIAMRSLARAIFQPRRPDWRLVNLNDRASASLASAMTWIGAVYALDLLLKEAIRILAMPLAVSVAAAAISSVLLAALLFKIIRTPFTPRPPRVLLAEQPSDALTAVPKDAPAPGEGSVDASWLAPRILKIPLLAVALFILGSSLSGYVALGRFVSAQVIVTGSVVVLVILLHLAIRALVGAEASQDRALGRVMHERLGLDDHQSRTVTKLAAATLDGLLALFALPFILVTWGFALPDTLAWLKSLIFGFEIGNVRISLAQIFSAVAIFAALLFLTRAVQRWTSGGLLTAARIDPGLANSIQKAIGYTGFVIALLAGLSYAGLDITNIAIVAGALSVGIGFGLQSIINNFVSGLILLFERPLKVGDLIVVDGQTGRVRNISVRSTEIETGDRATLIVPNSQLITSSFLNWTHRNVLASVTVPVKASYRSDPEHVRKVLEEVAAECPLLLQQPRPSASLDSFGTNGFEFSLSGNVADFGKRGAAMSDLRYRIIKAFRDNGIEMPLAQHDVHLRDLDFLKALAQRTQQADAPETPPASAQQPATQPAAARESELSAITPEAETRLKRRS